MEEKKHKSTFSKNLKQIRKEKGLSQGNLSKLTGLTMRMISYYENNASKPPIDKIECIAKALNVNINDLLGTPDETTEVQDFMAQIDSRTLKKLKIILSLTRQERHIIYTMAETFLNKRRKPSEKKEN